MKLTPPHTETLFNFVAQGSGRRSSCPYGCEGTKSLLEDSIAYFENLLEGKDNAQMGSQNIFIFGDYFKEGSTYHGSFNKIGNVAKHASILSHSVF